MKYYYFKLFRTLTTLLEMAFRQVFGDGPVDPSRIYTTDETGFMQGISGKETVVRAAGQRQMHLVQDGNRELTTVIPTICADGTKLHELMIFKGKRVMSDWYNGVEEDFRWA